MQDYVRAWREDHGNVLLALGALAPMPSPPALGPPGMSGVLKKAGTCEKDESTEQWSHLTWMEAGFIAKEVGACVIEIGNILIARIWSTGSVYHR